MGGKFVDIIMKFIAFTVGLFAAAQECRDCPGIVDSYLHDALTCVCRESLVTSASHPLPNGLNVCAAQYCDAAWGSPHLFGCSDVAVRVLGGLELCIVAAIPFCELKTVSLTDQQAVSDYFNKTARCWLPNPSEISTTQPVMPSYVAEPNLVTATNTTQEASKVQAEAKRLMEEMNRKIKAAKEVRYGARRIRMPVGSPQVVVV